jgi:hypothetical protein
VLHKRRNYLPEDFARLLAICFCFVINGFNANMAGMFYKEANNRLFVDIKAIFSKSSGVICVFFVLGLCAILPLAAQERPNQPIIIAPPPIIQTDQEMPPFPDKKESLTKEVKVHWPDQSLEIIATPPSQIELQEFTADALSGMPLLDESGKSILFYSDPSPLIREASPEPEEIAAMKQLERERVFPVIDAPVGLFDISSSSEKLVLVASHAYKNTAIKAGQTLGIDFLLTNPGDEKLFISEVASITKGARAAYELAPFVILPGQTIKRRASFFLDSTIAPGIHQASYQIRTVADKKAICRFECKFAVNSFPKVSFKLEPVAQIPEASQFKIAGKLENSGNVDLHLALNLDGEAENLNIIPNHISLPAGGHVIVELTGAAPARSHPLDNSLVLNLSAIAEQKDGNLKLLQQALKLRLAPVNDHSD